MKAQALILTICFLCAPMLAQQPAQSDAAASSSQQAEKLATQVDQLEAAGQWRKAIEPLQELLKLTPDDPTRLAQLGRYRSWQTGWREQALRLLKRSCELTPNEPANCTDYANVLSWRSEARPEAVQQLRNVLAKSPQFTPAIIKLADILSWDRTTHTEAISILENALQAQPTNASLLTAYGDVLASNKSTSSKAIPAYDRALSADPNQVGAITGKAQQLAWNGHSAEAITLYDRALALDPNNVAALRGKAEILNWRGEYDQAKLLLEKANESAPEDQRVSAELARANLGLRQYSSAHQYATKLDPGVDFGGVREDVTRTLATWTEFGISIRRNRQNLDYERLNVAVSTPIGFENRLTVRYAPTLYSTTAGDFNSNDYTLELNSNIGKRTLLNLMAGAQSYPGMSSQALAAGELRFRVNSAWELKFGGERTPVDESYFSLRGVNTLTGEYGQVSANLGNAGFSYNNAKHGFDFSATYYDGLFTGSGLESNRRWSVEGNAGKSLGGTPYFRIGYGVAYTSFDYDASSPLAPPNHFGDYFSPQRFLLNYGSLTVSHKFNERVQFEATGTAGAQNVETDTSSFSNTQFASSFTGRALWRIRPMDEIRIQYDFLNVYNAFHRHVPTISWRHYF